MTKLAIIGTGISGLGCAHFLHRHFDVTLFEQNGYVGGHTNTVTVPEAGTGRPLPIDTGFMVFNYATYPQLTRLFAALNVPVKKTDMSFSVRHEDTGLEFCGSSLNHLFAQRRNLLRPSFYRMLFQIDRFNRDAIAALDDPALDTQTLADYVRARGYGADFLDLYLVPMSSAVWSTPPDKMLLFPARALLRFFHNHGFLGLNTQHQWWTVDGGAQEYVKRLTAPWADRIRRTARVTRVTRGPVGTFVTTADGITQRFDKVILAAHGHESLALLADPTPDEARLLREFQYQANTATLHTDASVMPRTKLAWSAWNYSLARDATGRLEPMTIYWMNRLQGVSERENYFVSINRPDRIAPDRILKTISYEHPLFTLGAVRAQTEIPALNAAARGTTETYFCGAWTRYGFHEDGFLSAVNLSGLLLARDPWTG
ncbi:protoporphyrinogen oxidase [Lacunisphaera limnophila]|uniref:Protoporphyrinogen oxidase n=1 Tax=Lacunisphaera limnophila TaxID=1838286 RepID=A0A1D8ASM2_9BACT|nr:FAD-dependent oxidoreductase [Lacunisphaera limnophila]AOS43905.1 protoporphyrinogen oxidase [Lacunisphaera limnophila]